MSDPSEHYGVVILGGGLAGLSLARQLLRETGETVLLLERKAELPGARQKVGESLVQLGGYYFSKVLDLEQHLLDEHYMKYNLRFHWRTPGRDGGGFEDYSQSYIRTFSNVASFQLDRNVLEAELLRSVRGDPRFTLAAPAADLEVDLGAGGGPHTVRFTHGGSRRAVTASWVVDTTGRARLLARRLGLARPNRIRHGAFFWWVEGRVDVERLTDLTPRQRRLAPTRGATGHLPHWLATVHFMGDGYWFWVIPLRGKTSLGLVFDTAMIDPSDVFTVEKATEWVCRRHPLFARDLPGRRVLDSAGFRSFSYDCAQTLSADRWALAGEAGRFSDPLYSPGSDLIAIHNTLIVDAVGTGDPAELAAKCRRYEALMKAVYEAYVPSYTTGYPTLGEPEIFALKYSWELAVYFAAYVFPFLNDLFTDRRFLPAYLRFFARLGPLNRGLQELLATYHRWKRDQGRAWEQAGPRAPVCFDFTAIGPLAAAEKTFYRVGVTVEEAREVLRQQLESLRELARFALAHVAAEVAGDPELVRSRPFVAALDLDDLRFDPEGWRRRRAECAGGEEAWPWTFDPGVLERYRPAEVPEVEPTRSGGES